MRCSMLYLVWSANPDGLSYIQGISGKKRRNSGGSRLRQNGRRPTGISFEVCGPDQKIEILITGPGNGTKKHPHSELIGSPAVGSPSNRLKRKRKFDITKKE